MKKILAVFLISMVLLSGCQKSHINMEDKSKSADNPTTKNIFMIDTIISITLYGEDSQYIDDLFKLIEKYDKLLDSHDETSEIYSINSGENHKLNPEIKKLLERSIYYSELTDGLYDVTIAPLVDLWDIMNEPTSIPTEEAIETALKLIDYKNMEIIEDNITFKQEGTKIDLGGIAKGYIADRLIDYLKEKDVKHGVISLGGNIFVLGEKEPNVPFKVAVQDPDEVRGGQIGVLKVSDSSIVTSGIYERYVEIDGVKYHHMLNPFTGYPENNELKSVTIVSSNSMDGDAMSTSMFLLGLKKGMNLVESLDNMEAIFITKDNEIVITKGIKNSFTLNNDKYTLVNDDF